MVKTEQITIRVSEELKRQIEEHCEKDNVPMAQYIRNLIIDDLKK